MDSLVKFSQKSFYLKNLNLDIALKNFENKLNTQDLHSSLTTINLQNIKPQSDFLNFKENFFSLAKILTKKNPGQWELMILFKIPSL